MCKQWTGLLDWTTGLLDWAFFCIEVPLVNCTTYIVHAILSLYESMLILNQGAGVFLGFESEGCYDCCCELTHAQHGLLLIDMTSPTHYHFAVLLDK